MSIPLSDVYKAPNGRLREAGAHRIHELCENGNTYQQVAEVLEISIGTVYNVRTGKTWGFVKEERAKPKLAG